MTNPKQNPCWEGTSNWKIFGVNMLLDLMFDQKSEDPDFLKTMKPRESGWVGVQITGQSHDMIGSQSHDMLQFVETISVHGLSAAGQVALALLTSGNFHRNILIIILANRRAHSFSVNLEVVHHFTPEGFPTEE